MTQGGPDPKFSPGTPVWPQKAQKGPWGCPDHLGQFLSHFDGTKTKKSSFGLNRPAQLNLPQKFARGPPFGPPKALGVSGPPRSVSIGFRRDQNKKVFFWPRKAS